MKKKIQIYALFIEMSEAMVYSLMQSAKKMHGYSFQLEGEPTFDWKLALKILSDLQPKAAQKIKFYA